MKSFASFILLFGLLQFAFVRAETHLSIVAQKPVDCKKVQSTYVNWISNVHKISENMSEAVFVFRTALGSCSANAFLAAPLDSRSVLIEFIHDGLHAPWKKEPYKIRTKNVSPDWIEVELSLNKNELFKKKNRRNFQMSFSPVFNYYFFWNVTAEQQSESDTRLSIKLI